MNLRQYLHHVWGNSGTGVGANEEDDAVQDMMAEDGRPISARHADLQYLQSQARAMSSATEPAEFCQLSEPQELESSVKQPYADGLSNCSFVGTYPAVT